MDQKQEPGRPPHPDILTPAEWRVADGVRHGLSNPEIAARQGVSANAVKYHVSNILAKLGLASRRELQRWSGIAANSPMTRTENAQESDVMIGQIARTVSDVERDRAWFRDVLGLEHLFDAGEMAFFDCGGVRLMLTEGDAGPESLIYFRVSDLADRLDEITAAGTKLISAPHKIHTHDDGSEEWMAFVADCDGRPIGLMSVSPSQS